MSAGQSQQPKIHLSHSECVALAEGLVSAFGIDGALELVRLAMEKKPFVARYPTGEIGGVGLPVEP